MFQVLAELDVALEGFLADFTVEAFLRVLQVGPRVPVDLRDVVELFRAHPTTELHCLQDAYLAAG